jgi:hypothetical protein
MHGAILQFKGTMMPDFPRMGCLLLGICLVAGCAGKTDVDVNLHGVNYGGDAFSFYITDPADPKSSGTGGGIINPFAAGGTTCCFTLPKKWRPGIKVQVRTTHWLPQEPDGNLPEVKKIHLVDVPQYANGKPGELWVLRAADGSVDVISSDFQPDHPDWPGTPKGWPVPSLEYRRERWEIYRKEQEGFIRNGQVLLEKLEKAPLERAKLAWEHATIYGREELSGFSGPTDPRYVEYLKKDYQQGITESRAELERLMKVRP